ncbi:MAG: helix-turn-helix domain containing protein [Novosphingobium sp.]|nr:helix-turn-helix domain containing protein [Novosphingobium sp.]
MQDARTSEPSPGKPATRRGRPPGRSADQERQRRRTRETILAAAADVFSAKTYVHATVEDLLAAAGVSRATFYDHFASKLALAIAMYDAIADDWISHFDKLASRRSWPLEALRDWVEELAGLYSAHGFVTPLVDQLAIFEESFRKRTADDRDALIARLAAKGIASFAAAMGNAPEAVLQRARMQILLLQLDRVCAMIANAETFDPAEKSAFVAVMAEELRDAL